MFCALFHAAQEECSTSAVEFVLGANTMTYNQVASVFAESPMVTPARVMFCARTDRYNVSLVYAGRTLPPPPKAAQPGGEHRCKAGRVGKHQ